MKLKAQTLAQDICKRATRNCPWHGGLWSECIRILSRTSSPASAVEEVYRKSYTSPLSAPYDLVAISQAYCDHHVWAAQAEVSLLPLCRFGALPSLSISASRRIFSPLRSLSAQERESEGQETAAKEALERALAHAEEVLGEKAPGADGQCPLARYLARIEAAVLEDMEAARERWEKKILVGEQGKQAHLWLEYAASEREHGEPGTSPLRLPLSCLQRGGRARASCPLTRLRPPMLRREVPFHLQASPESRPGLA